MDGDEEVFPGRYAHLRLSVLFTFAVWTAAPDVIPENLVPLKMLWVVWEIDVLAMQ